MNFCLTAAEKMEELQRLHKIVFTKSPGLAGVLFYTSYEVDETDNICRGRICAVDSKQAVYGKRFFELAEVAQLFVICRAILTIALSHPGRIFRYVNHSSHPQAARIGQLASKLVLNDCLLDVPFISDAGAVCMPALRNFLPKAVLEESPVGLWSLEKTCSFLEDVVARQWKLFTVPQEDLEKLLDNFTAFNFPSLDLVEVEKQPENDRRNWRQRTNRATAGDSPLGAMRRVSRDLDQPEMPWPAILRQYLMAGLSPQQKKDMGVPGYETMAVEALGIFPSTLVVDYADSPQHGMDTLVVVQDTSGSMGDAVLEMALAQADVCRKMLQCKVVFMACDAAVYNAVTIQSHEPLLQKIKQHRALRGGGGTDFRPAVIAANKIPNARLILYFTDLLGSFPLESKVPIVWAATEKMKEQEDFQPPIGKTVWLSEYGVRAKE